MEEVVESGRIQRKLEAGLGAVFQKEPNLTDLVDKIQQSQLHDLQGNAAILGNRLDFELKSLQQALTQTTLSLRVSLNNSSAQVVSGLAALQATQVRLGEVMSRVGSEMRKSKERQRTLESSLKQRILSLGSHFEHLGQELRSACTSLSQSAFPLQLELLSCQAPAASVSLHNSSFFTIEGASLRVERDGKVVNECDLPIIRGSSKTSMTVNWAEAGGTGPLQLTAVQHDTFLSLPLRLNPAHSL